MNCPFCQGKTRVIDSWPKNSQVLRVRRCKVCGKEIETRERRTVHEQREGRWSK